MQEKNQFILMTQKILLLEQVVEIKEQLKKKEILFIEILLLKKKIKN